MKRARLKQSDRKFVLFLIALAVIGIAVTVSQQREAADAVKNGIRRGLPGYAAETFTYYYSLDGNGDEKKSLRVQIHPQALSEEKSLQLLDRAENQWESEYLGENSSAEKVSKDLKLSSTFEDGFVRAEYEFSDYEFIDTYGHVQQHSMPKDGAEVTLKALFICGEYRLEQVKTLKLFKREATAEEQLEKDVAAAVRDQERATRSSNKFVLPTEVNGKKISWSTETQPTGAVIILLGIAATFALRLKSRERASQNARKWRHALEMQYPQMLEQFSLLLGSGMTIRGAWERMVGNYQMLRQRRRCEQKEYLEEMTMTWREIRDGRGERESYERFGRRTGLKSYRRFCSILTQNLSKGTRDISGILEIEAEEALEQRRTNARRLGEEAGAKLLGPMMVMFLVVLVVILVPAAQNL